MVSLMDPTAPSPRVPVMYELMGAEPECEMAQRLIASSLSTTRNSIRKEAECTTPYSHASPLYHTGFTANVSSNDSSADTFTHAAPAAADYARSTQIPSVRGGSQSVVRRQGCLQGYSDDSPTTLDDFDEGGKRRSDLRPRLRIDPRSPDDVSAEAAFATDAATADGDDAAALRFRVLSDTSVSSSSSGGSFNSDAQQSSEAWDRIGECQKQYRRLLSALGHCAGKFSRMVDFLLSLHQHYQVMHPNTIYVSLDLLVSFSICQQQLDLRVEENFKLTACLALFVAAKFEEGLSLSLEPMLDRIRHGCHPYPTKLFLRAEMTFCHLIDFDIWRPNRFSEAMRILKEEQLCLVEFEIAKSNFHTRKLCESSCEWRNTLDQLRVGYLVRFLLRASILRLVTFAYTPFENARAVVAIAKYSLRYISMICEDERILELCQIIHSTAMSMSLSQRRIRRPSMSLEKSDDSWMFEMHSLLPSELYLVHQMPRCLDDSMMMMDHLLSTPGSTPSLVSASTALTASSVISTESNDSNASDTSRPLDSS